MTNSTKFRNDILKNNIYHNFELRVINDTSSTTKIDEDYNGEYEDGLESSQAMLLKNYKNSLLNLIITWLS